MKRFLYVFLTVLLAFPAIAEGQVTTPCPEIRFEQSQDQFTIIVEGSGILTVQVLRDNNHDGDISTVIDEAQVEGYYEYTIQRSYDDSFSGLVIATAQEEGKQPSETVTREFVMRSYFFMPVPEISFVEEDGGVTGIVTNIGPFFEITVTINDEMYLHDTASGGDNYTFFVPCTYEEQYIHVNAVNNGSSHGDVWQGATASYILYALEMPMAAAPVIVVDEGEEYYTVSAYSLEGNATVYLFKDGEPVRNPCEIMRTDEDQTYVFTAYVVVPNMNQSETVTYTVDVPAIVPPPMEMTATPTISCEYVTLYDGTNAAYITIAPTEEGDPELYYRYLAEGNEFSDWIQYTGQMCFTEPGFYLLEAYAIADGMTASEVTSMSFTVFEPVVLQLYDFEEDGIFYKITSEGKVSVSSETTDYNTYSGDVTIPNTVTHDGVTYMVTAIAENAFRDCVNLTSVVIGNYVTTIGDNAFYNNVHLKSVTIGDYVTTIGENAFYYCGELTTLKLGSGLKNLDRQAFSSCGALTDITCKAATPPGMDYTCFDANVYNTATLHVYPPVLDSYKSDYYWKRFTNTVGEDQVAPVAGDANGDGKVSISDVTTLINSLMGN